MKRRFDYFVVKIRFYFRLCVKDTERWRKCKETTKRTTSIYYSEKSTVGHYLPPLLPLLLPQPITFVEKKRACVRCPFYGSNAGRGLWEHERAMSVEVTLCG